MLEADGRSTIGPGYRLYRDGIVTAYTYLVAGATGDDRVYRAATPRSSPSSSHQGSVGAKPAVARAGARSTSCDPPTSTSSHPPGRKRRAPAATTRRTTSRPSAPPSSAARGSKRWTSAGRRRRAEVGT